MKRFMSQNYVLIKTSCLLNNEIICYVHLHFHASNYVSPSMAWYESQALPVLLDQYLKTWYIFTEIEQNKTINEISKIKLCIQADIILQEMGYFENFHPNPHPQEKEN